MRNLAQTGAGLVYFIPRTIHAAKWLKTRQVNVPGIEPETIYKVVLDLNAFGNSEFTDCLRSRWPGDGRIFDRCCIRITETSYLEQKLDFTLRDALGKFGCKIVSIPKSILTAQNQLILYSHGRSRSAVCADCQRGATPIGLGRQTHYLFRHLFFQRFGNAL